MTNLPETLETIIIPRARDLGEFEVRRALPSAKRQMVGPFIFFDQFGPATFAAGEGINVRPHPHIGLGTVTYLFEGAIHHKDSLGNALDIEPGAVNWMLAGSGITHSERLPEQLRGADGKALSGLQTWLALPSDKEDVAPDFTHVAKDNLPIVESDGIYLRLVLGDAYGASSVVPLLSETLYADVRLQPGADFPLPENHEDRGLYVIEGEVSVGDQVYGPGQMLVFKTGGVPSVTAGVVGAHVMLFGGATLEGHRHIWWNLVSSSKDKIEYAKEEWRKGQAADGDFSGTMFDLPVGDDAEFIPLPDNA